MATAAAAVTAVEAAVAGDILIKTATQPFSPQRAVKGAMSWEDLHEIKLTADNDKCFILLG